MRSARALLPAPTLGAYGFELRAHESQARLTDEASIKSVYYPEVEALVTEATGHAIRARKGWQRASRGGAGRGLRPHAAGLDGDEPQRAPGGASGGEACSLRPSWLMHEAIPDWGVR